MPWLTPDEIPEGDDCRPLSIPADSVWLSLISGALTELTKPYNWQQFGAMTVQETVEKMQSIIDGYYADPCTTCETPGGYRIIRISVTGHVEELGDDGNWQPGTGDYYIPPPDAREGGTESDQICLAAKNAVNVLEQLYENLTDSWNTNLDDAEAQTAFILGLIALVGFEFAPITWGIVAFMTAVFAALYTTLEFVGADLWDTAVSAQITCFLQNCATNDGGVVTFDWDCFLRQLHQLTDTFSLTEAQLRLYLQISYMLYFIGGVDGLNLAGATTEITDDDCTGCECSGTSVNFGVSDQGFLTNAWGTFPAAGTYENGFNGFGIYASTVGGFNQIGVSGEVAEVCGDGININYARGAVPASATVQIRVTTATQVKNVTFVPEGLIVSATYHWDEGGTLLPDSAVVDIGYVGSSGYGFEIASLQTGDV